MKTIVISAVNLRKGGTLTILRNCLEYLSALVQESDAYRVVALVHKKELADYPGIEYIELPWTVKSWLLRLWCEYVTGKKLAATPMVRICNHASAVQTAFARVPLAFLT